MPKRILIAINNLLDERTHIDRLLYIWIGFLIILLLWFILFAFPLIDTKYIFINKARATANDIQLVEAQINALNIKSNALVDLRNKKIAENKKNMSTQKIAVTNVAADKIIQQLLNVDQSIKAIKVQSAVVSGTNPSLTFEIQFTSGYFDSMKYLARMESLQWCLIWDNLEYQVQTYPDGNVKIKVHTLPYV